MITTGKEIYNILSSDTEVNRLVGEKIYPLIIPEGTKLPCIVYQRNYSNTYSKDGLANSESNVDITIISLDYDEASEISIAVFNALNMKTNDTIKISRLISGDEVYAEGAYIQNMVFYVMSV